VIATNGNGTVRVQWDSGAIGTYFSSDLRSAT